MFTNLLTFLVLLQDEAAEEATGVTQNEYTTVYALVFAMIFLGFLAIGIPRLRKTTIAETDAEKKKRTSRR